MQAPETDGSSKLALLQPKSQLPCWQPSHRMATADCSPGLGLMCTPATVRYQLQVQPVLGIHPACYRHHKHTMSGAPAQPSVLMQCQPAQGHMLQACFPELVGPLVARLREWTAGLRSQGARMLHALLLRVGSAAEEQLPLLLTALRAAAGKKLGQEGAGEASGWHLAGMAVPVSWLRVAVWGSIPWQI